MEATMVAAYTTESSPGSFSRSRVDTEGTLAPEQHTQTERQRTMQENISSKRQEQPPLQHAELQCMCVATWGWCERRWLERFGAEGGCSGSALRR